MGNEWPKKLVSFLGGGEGVMEAIAKGVSLGGGTCIGILKDKDFKTGNEYLVFQFQLDWI